MNLNVQISEVEALPPGTNPIDPKIDSTSMAATLATDPDWMFVFNHHRHNDHFTLVHVPTGTRKRVELSPKHVATAEAARKAERDGGYGTKVKFGDTGQKRYRCLVPENYTSDFVSHAEPLMTAPGPCSLIGRLGGRDVELRDYKSLADEKWLEVSFTADDKAFDRIFDSGQFSGIEAV